MCYYICISTARKRKQKTIDKSGFLSWTNQQRRINQRRAALDKLNAGRQVVMIRAAFAVVLVALQLEAVMIRAVVLFGFCGLPNKSRFCKEFLQRVDPIGIDRAAP